MAFADLLIFPIMSRVNKVTDTLSLLLDSSDRVSELVSNSVKFNHSGLNTVLNVLKEQERIDDILIKIRRRSLAITKIRSGDGDIPI